MALTRVPPSGVLTNTQFTLAAVAVTATTIASSTITGAVTIAGGLGVGGNIWVGGTINASVTGVATSSTNIAGGTAGQVPYQTAAGTTNFFGPGTAGNVLVSYGSAGTPTFQNTLTLAGTTAATSTQTGALVVTGGVGIGGNLYVGGDIVATKLTIQYTTVTTTSVTTDDVFTTYNTTPTSSTSTGALVIAGGAGFGGGGYFGGIVTATNMFIGQWAVNTGSVNSSTLMTVAVNLASGTAGQLHYQTAPNTSGFISTATSGNFLQANYTGAPTWTTTGSMYVYRATVADTVNNFNTATLMQTASNLAGGTAGQFAYQTAPSTTAFMSTGSMYVGRAVTADSASGAAGSVANALSTGTGLLLDSGTSYNGSAAKTISLNTSTYMALAATATSANKVANAHSAGAGLTGTAFDGSAAVTWTLNTATLMQVATQVVQSHSTGTGILGSAFNGSTAQTWTLDTSTLMARAVQTVQSLTAGAGLTGTAFNGSTAQTWTLNTATLMQTAVNLASGTAGQFAYQSAANTTAFMSTGSMYVGRAVIADSASGGSAQVNTIAQTASANYYPTFVDTNNASSTAETVYTTSSFFINPASGFVGIGASNTSSRLTVAGRIESTTDAASEGGQVILRGKTLYRWSIDNYQEQFRIIREDDVTEANGIAALQISSNTNATVMLNASTPYSGEKLAVNGGVYVNGIVTATSFVGAFTGTASNATTATSAGTAYATIGTHTAGTGLTGTAFNGSANQTWTLNTATLMANAVTAINLASGSAGSLPYQSGAGATTFLGVGSANQILTSSGTAPQWTSASSITGVGSVANSVTFNNSNTGDASGTTYNGSAARTVSANTLGALSLASGGTVSGAVTFSGPVTFSGTATYVSSTQTYYTDNIINLHVPAGGVDAGWTLDDGKDIGFRFHYYTNSTDTNAALVLANDSKFLEWYAAGAEGTSTFVGSYYGNFKTGNIVAGRGLRVGSLASSTATVVGEKLYVSGGIYATDYITATTFVGAMSQSITAGAGLTGTAYNGGTAQTWTLNTSTLMNKVVNLAGGVAGSLPYQSAADTTTYLGIGTSGYILTSNGSAPTWTAATGLSAGSATTATSAGTAYATIGTLTAGTGLSGTAFNGSANQTWTLNTATLMNIATQVVQSHSAGTGLTGSAYNGSTAQTWSLNTATLMANAVTAINLAGGTAGQFAYQTGAGATSFMSTGSMYVGRAVTADSASGAAGSVANALTISTGLSGTSATYNGSAAVTITLNTATLMATAVTALSANQVANSLTAGTGLSGTAYNGSAAQTWTLNTATLMASAVSAINLSAGSAMAVPYQSASGTTAYLAAGTSGYVLTTNGTGSAPSWVAASSLTSGSAGSVTYALTMNNGGAGDASGTTYNGGAARTISYNTIGAPSTTGANASGTWGINISGNLTGSAPQLAAATESNSVYITAPSYTTDKPVKLLNFDWYGNVFSMGNIRSGATPSSGFGFYYTASGGAITELARFTTAGALSFGTSGTAYGTSGQILQSNGNAAPSWVSPSTVLGTSFTNSTQEFTATAGQTVFTVTNGYTASYVQVYANGFLLAASDYTATNGSTVTLNDARAAGDIIRVISPTTVSSYVSSLTSTYVGYGSGSNALTGSSSLTWDGTSFYVNGKVGVGTSSPVSKLHVAGAGNVTGGNIHLGDNTDAAAKWTYITAAHYNGATNATGVALIGHYASSTENSINIGGNIYEAHPATNIQFYTYTSNTHTLGGTLRLTITKNGGFAFGSSASNYGTSGQILQSNGDAPPTWVNAPSTALTSTYVGFGSGSNLLTGSANLTWDGTILSVLGASSNGYIKFATNTGTKLRFYDASTDKYGIDVQSSELRIYSGAQGASTGGITFGKYDGTTYTQAAIIRNDGNVGFGTTAPKTKLQSSGAAQTTSPTLGSITGAGLYVTNTDEAYGLLAGVASNGNAWLQVQRTDAGATSYNLNLQPSGGNVGIGTTSPGYKLEVNGNTYASGIGITTSGFQYAAYNSGRNRIWSFANADGYGLAYFQGSGGFSGSTDMIGMHFGTASAAASQFSFVSNGNLYATGDIYSSYSDIRLKSVQGKIETPLDLLESIETFYYEPNELALKLGATAGRKVGVSAQSVEQVMPEAVSTASFGEGEYLTVQYERLVPLLIESIKELRAEVNSLKTEIADLKNNK